MGERIMSVGHIRFEERQLFGIASAEMHKLKLSDTANTRRDVGSETKLHECLIRSGMRRQRWCGDIKRIQRIHLSKGSDGAGGR